MAAGTADAVEFQPGMRRRRIRWRRYIGLSVPALIALVVLIAGVFAELLQTHDPEFIDLAARLAPPVFRRRHLGSSAGHGRTRTGHLQPLAARGAGVVDRRRDRRAGRRPVWHADWVGLGLGRGHDRADPDARGRPAVGPAGDPVCRTDGQPGRSQPDQCDRDPVVLDLAVVFASGSCRCALVAGARLRHGLASRLGRPRGGSCASTSCPMCSTPS